MGRRESSEGESGMCGDHRLIVQVAMIEAWEGYCPRGVFIGAEHQEEGEGVVPRSGVCAT
jgi:hypothetical protein